MRTIKRLKVEVGQEEIDTAIAANSRKCMIQESMKRDYPELKNIWVDKNQVRATDPDRNVIYTFDMPPLGKAEILLWDEGTQVKPFYIILRNPTVRKRTLKPASGDKPARWVPQSSVDRAIRSSGAIPQPRDKQRIKESRAMRGRDRVFGQKLWTEELTKLRETLAVKVSSE